VIIDVKNGTLHVMTNKEVLRRGSKQNLEAKDGSPTITQADWFRTSDAAALGIDINLFMTTQAMWTWFGVSL